MDHAVKAIKSDFSVNEEKDDVMSYFEKGQQYVVHPYHYGGNRKYEPKDVIRDWDLNFNLGNVVKYLSRAGRKGDSTIDIYQDLLKAKAYLQFELDAVESELTENVNESKGE